MQKETGSSSRPRFSLSLFFVTGADVSYFSSGTNSTVLLFAPGIEGRKSHPGNHKNALTPSSL